MTIIIDFTTTSCLITCFVICILYSIIKKLIERRHLYIQALKFDGPADLPFIGSAYLFIGNNEVVLEKIIQLGKLYQTPFRIWLGHRLVFGVNTPEQMKIIYHSSKTIDRDDLHDFLQPWLGTGLFTARAAKWRVHRKLIQPTFNTNVLQSFVEVFAAKSVIMVKEMERHLDEREFEIYKYLSLYALDSICETTMGVKLEAQTNSDCFYAEAAHKVLHSTWKRMLSPWLHPDFIFYRTRIGEVQKKYVKILHDFANDAIQKKKKNLQKRSDQLGLDKDKDDECNWMPRRKVFLDHLMEMSDENGILSDKALREEVDTMIFAGSDTTANIASSVMLMLASHPEVQEKVYRELCEIYGEDDDKEVHITPEHLTCMKYLERVIKETMRLFPISAILTRTVADDLDIDGQIFPKGSFIIASIMDLHRSEKYWPDPLKFDPDRFLLEEVAKRDSYAYLPFGIGPRNCIGSKYAMMSMMILLTTILRRYVLKKDDIVPVKDIRLKIEFLLRTVEPITLRIEKRTRKIASI